MVSNAEIGAKVSRWHQAVGGLGDASIGSGADVHGNRIAVRIQTRAQPRRAHRTVGRSDRPVLLAGPLQLDRLALQCLGHHHGVLGLRPVAVPAVTASEVRAMEVHLLLGDPGDL